ncbi:MAG: amidohydrolase family protein [Candidatus Latescibacteria bacterium]|jgi:predicted TIM-barrel fold metal-dependent hydrolase|nr:amidohydrolase family protein [Candidatus Latescibacterota bacterium]
MAIDIAEAVREYDSRRGSLHLFDVNAWLGEQPGPHLAGIETPEGLLEVMDRCHIEQAVVTSTTALHAHTGNGNLAVADALETSDRLVGGYILLPTFTGEQGSTSAPEAIDRAVDQGFRLFRLFPLSMSFTLDDWCVGDLLAHLQHRRLPLCIWHSETTWSHIAGICHRYPDLPMIVEGSGRKIIYDCRTCYPLLDRHPNLLLELHGFINYGLMEDFERRGFAGRVLFGTGMPFVDPDLSLGLIGYADITAENAARVAGGTLRGILGGVR